MLKTPSLKGYWRFEDNANDDSGNGNHGTIYGAVSATGKFGKALYFDGNDYVDVSGVSGLVASGSYTCAMWVSPDNTLEDRYFIQLGDMPSDNDFVIWCSLNSKKFYFKQYASGWKTASSVTLGQAGTWYHLAGVLDVSLGMFLYVNGVLEGTHTNTARGSTASTHTYLGRNFTGVGRQKGLIDEVLIYNRALSLPDIKRIMMGIHPLNG